MLSTPDPTPPTKLETNFVYGILLAAFLVQANAIFHHGNQGQDFEFHLKWVQAAADHPWQWLFTPQDRTSPPLYHYLVSLVYLACNKIHWLVMTGLISACINVLALRLLYATARLLISSLPLRLALLVLVAFLPVSMIHTVVMAADSLSQLPFFVILYALVSLCLNRMGSTRAFIYVAIASFISFATKYIAVSFLPAMLCAVPCLCHARVLSWRRGLTYLAIFLCLGSSLEYYWLTQKTSNITDNFMPSMGGLAKPPEKINLRSLLFFRPGDAYLLDVPTYRVLAHNYPTAPQSLYNTNYFSFPGLAIYVTFSDPSGIFQVKGREKFGYRMAVGMKTMPLAVKIGLVTTVAALLGACWVGLAACRQLWSQRRPEAAAIICIGLFSAAWLAFIMTLLPLATLGIFYGYWHPRLFLPSIWGIALLGFYAFDQGLLGRRWAGPLGQVILGATIVQAVIHFSFLFRWMPY